MSDDDDTIDFFIDLEDEITDKNQTPLPQPLKAVKIIQENKHELGTTEYLSLNQSKAPVFTKQPSDIKINEFDMKESDLTNSFENFNDPNPYHSDYDSDVGCSVYMQSQQYKTYYPPKLQSQEIPEPSKPKPVEEKKGRQNTAESIPIDQSYKSNKPPLPAKNFFAKKKQSYIASPVKNDINIADSALEMNVPTTGVLKHMIDIKGSYNESVSSGDSNGKLRKSVRLIEGFEINKDLKEIRFMCNDQTDFKKEISQAYLEYIEKYFFTYFNILLPLHIQHVLESPSGVQTYLTIYFDYIVAKHPIHLLEFLQKSHFKEVPKTSVATENTPAASLQAKFFQYKNMLFNTIYSGYDIVENAVKKMKGEVQTPVRLLERLFFKQLEMAEKHYKARAKMENVLGSSNSIHPSIYQKGGLKNKQYVLMCLRWLVGFEMTVDLVKEKQQKADPVENEKLQMLLGGFMSEKQKQQREKMVILQSKVKNIYE